MSGPKATPHLPRAPPPYLLVRCYLKHFAQKRSEPRSSGTVDATDALVPANLQPHADDQHDEAPLRPERDTLCHFPARVPHTGGLRTKLHSLQGNALVTAADSAERRASSMSMGASTTCWLARGSADLEEALWSTTTAGTEAPSEELEDEGGRAPRTSSRVQARAARAAQDVDSSSGTSRTYSKTVLEPHLPKSWMAQMPTPALANPWAPVALREWPLTRADPSSASKGTPSLRAASTIVSVM